MLNFRFGQRSLRTVLLSFATLCAIACGQNGQATGSSCPSDSTLSYQTFGQAFVATHCLSCHGAAGPESPALSTLAQIQANADVIDEQAAAGPNATNTLMPESGSVSTEDRMKLGEWLACGAPE